MNGDPPLPLLTTEQIQKCLEENKDLILAILEGQNHGKFAEIALYQAKLQHNLTCEDHLINQPNVQVLQQQQQPQVAMSQQQPDFSTLNSAFYTNEQQQQQHLAMSLHQADISASKLGFQMNEQYHKLPNLFQQQQLFPEGMNSFTGTNNSGMQTRNYNLQETPSLNQMGSDFGPDWS